MIYYEYSRGADRVTVGLGMRSLNLTVAPQLCSSPLYSCWDARSIAFLEVKSCSKAFFAPIVGHGKSPCFSEVAFLQLLDPDYPLLILPYVDGADFLECAL